MLQHDNPLFTIITVVYNGESHLEETIKSVLNQSYENYEYIIIDGGSSDGTLDIIERYAHAIDYWISEKDDGIYDAMNKGIKLASGKYTAFINADDYYSHDTLQAVADFLKNYPQTEFVYSDINVIDESGKMLFYWRGNAGNDQIGDFIPHPSCFISTAWLQDNHFDLKFEYAADYELIVRLIDQGIEKRYLHHTVAYYRAGGSSASFKSRLECFQINYHYFGLLYAIKILSLDSIQKILSSGKSLFSRLFA